MMWDTAIPTAGKICANHPDICFRNKKTNTCLLIDISCPADGNIARRQAEKLTKCSALWVEVNRRWQCWTLVVPVVLGVLGTVHASIARWLDIIPGHHNLQHFQKSVFGFSIKSHIFCLDSYDGLNSSKVYVGFASGAYQRPYEPG